MLNYLIAFGITLAASIAVTTTLAADAAKPNIVVILADDLRADCIGAVNPRIHTPNIDRIARRGVRFDNAYIMGGNCAAVCTPSRVMLMTGRTLFNLPNDIYAEGNKPSLPVMSTVFRQAGYDSLYCGKHGNTYRPANRSFDKFVNLGHPGAKKKSEEEAFYASPVTSWLAAPARQDKPFFVFYAPSIPHDPLCPLPEDLARYAGDKCPPLPPNAAAQHADVAGFNLHDTNIRTFDVPGMGKFKTPLDLKQWPQVIAHYYAYTTLLDRQVGRILDELERTGADKNTIIVFTSDNGHSFADQGLIHKQSVYEQDIRVPMIVAGPGIPAGKVSDAFVYISDLFPTLCEKIGTPTPDTVRTMSFLPTLLDPAKPHRPNLYFMYANILFAQKLGRDNDEMRAYRDDQYKIILFNNQCVRLFDLKADPYERKDLSKDQPGRVAAMIKQARQAGKALGEEQAKMKFWQLFDGKIPQSSAATKTAKPATRATPHPVEKK